MVVLLVKTTTAIWLEGFFWQIFKDKEFGKKLKILGIMKETFLFLLPSVTILKKKIKFVTNPLTHAPGINVQQEFV